MTAAFTKRFGRVIACDLDAAFLERLPRDRGRVRRREPACPRCTSADGRTLDVADRQRGPDVQLHHAAALRSGVGRVWGSAARRCGVTKPGGRIALNYRTWTTRDVVLWPVGGLVRLHVEAARHRRRALPAAAPRPGSAAQANRLAPRRRALAELRADRLAAARTSPCGRRPAPAARRRPAPR